MDLAKYRTLFLEEAIEQLAEMSRGLLELEKDPAAAEAIDQVFRSAHSIKGMAASLGYDAITEVSHHLEDRMDVARRAGRVEVAGLERLFDGLVGLERMVAFVREHGEGPEADAALVARLSEPLGGGEGAAGSGVAEPPEEEPGKKVRAMDPGAALARTRGPWRAR